jgi:rubredoxin
MGKKPEAKPAAPKAAAEKYICTICGYVYDSSKGDPENGVKPNTAWKDVPSDWVCPVCGATKDQFEKK